MIGENVSDKDLMKANGLILIINPYIRRKTYKLYYRYSTLFIKYSIYTYSYL